MSFVHLHNHTSYSLLDGAAKIDPLIRSAKKDGQPGIAITDHGNLYGLIDFYKTAKQHEINPILGIEAYFADDRTDRTPKKKGDSDIDGSDKRYYHLTVLAENNAGYQNLIKLSSDAFLSGYFYKPRCDWELLDKYSNGLIVTTGCLGGPVLQELMHGRFDRALAAAGKLRDIFGKDNVFVELQNHGLVEQVRTNPELIEIAKQLDLGMVATNDCHYVNHEDHLPHDVLLCVQTAAKQHDEKRFKFQSDQHYLKSAVEMRELFREVESACDNTVLISERANVNIDFNTLHLPVFDVPEKYESADDYLAALSFAGLRKRYGSPTAEQNERLEYELKVLKTLGLSAYFLIVWDICRFADRQGIRRGPARGSVAGSLVAYCMNISQVDPLRHNLIFERFLNPDRIAMPDIDLDWDTRYRDTIINYTKEKYGEDHVAQIVTFSVIRARAAVRDAARVLDYDQSVADRISKAMPELVMGEATPLDACFEYNPRYDIGYKNAEGLRDLYAADPDVRKIVDVAKGLEGLIRQDGIHAAGVVITPEPLTEYVPVQRKKAKDGSPGPLTTQYEKNTVEDLGLLKMDYLGLKNLDIISECIRLVRSDVEIGTSFDDLKTFDLLRLGNTIGVFQLESKPMRQLLVRLQPTSIDDIAAVVALYRPGPMGTNMHNDYADRKNHRQPVSYIHDDARDILKRSYGLCIYQEQVMQMAQRFAGYTMAEADGLRKIIGKKLIDKMAAEHDKFVQGCIHNGYDKSLGEQMFTMIESFAAYAFNASHAYGYAYISYQTAYLKANYPKEYMAALCSAADEKDKCAFFLNEARSMGLTIKPPSINSSDITFTVEPDGIRVGLSAIKNVGEEAALKIVEARENGPFTSLVDFAHRANPGVGEFDSLAKSGALEMFGTRFGVASICKELMSAVRKEKKKLDGGQDTLFDTDTLWTFDVPERELPAQLMLEHEYEVLGLYVSGHPLDDYKEWNTGWTIAELDQCRENEYHSFFVMVAAKNVRKTRAGAMMATLSVHDQTGSKDVVMFPKTYAEKGGTVNAGDIGVMKVRIGKDTYGEQSVIFNGFDKMDVPEQVFSNDFKVYLPAGFGNNDNYVARLKATLSMYPGNRPVLLQMSKSSCLKLPKDILVDGSTQMVESLRQIFKDFSES